LCVSFEATIRTATASELWSNLMQLTHACGMNWLQCRVGRAAQQSELS
jgi:hypothetical protein